MKRFTTLSYILFFTLLTSTVHAKVQHMHNTDFSGTIDQVDSNYTGNFSIGDPFTGRATVTYFKVDGTTTDTAELGNLLYDKYGISLSNRFTEIIDETRGSLVFGVGSATVTVGSAGRQFTQVSNNIRYLIGNDDVGNGIDYFAFQESLPDFADDVPGGSIAVDFKDRTAAMFSDYNLPTSIPDSVTGRFSLVSALTTDFGNILSGDISNVSISVAPIPGTVWLMGSALLGLGFFNKRKAKA